MEPKAAASPARDIADTTPFSYSDLISALRRHVVLIVALTIAGLILGVWWSSRQREVYRSTAMLYTNSSREPQQWSLGVANFAATGPVLEHALKTAGDAQRGYAMSGLHLLPAGFELALDGRFIRLHVADANSEHAAKLANAWADAVIQLKKAQFGGSSDDAFSKREQAIASRLSAAQKELADLGFQDETRESVLEKKVRREYPNSLRQSIDAVQARITQLRLELQKLSAEEQHLVSLKGAEDRIVELPRAQTHEAIRGLRQEILTEAALLEKERRNSTPDSEAIGVHSKRLASLRASAAAHLPALTAEIQSDQKLASAEIEKQELLLKQLREQLAHAYSRLASLEKEMAELDFMREQLGHDSAERAASHLAELSVFNPAIASATPYKRVYGSVIVAALGLLGLFSGAGFGLALELLGKKVRGPRQLGDSLNLHPAVLIPRAQRPSSDMAVKEASPAAEALKKLALGVIPGVGKGAVVSAVVSSRNGEGASWIAANIAALAASAGKRTLLIDSSQQSSSLSRQWNLSGGESFASFVLRPQWSASVAVPREGFHVLPSGAGAAAAKLMTVDAVRAAFDALRPHFDVIIVDTEPLLHSASAVSIAASADTAVFVVRNRFVTTSEVERSLEILRRTPDVRMVTALNDVDALDMAF